MLSSIELAESTLLFNTTLFNPYLAMVLPVCEREGGMQRGNVLSITLKTLASNGRSRDLATYPAQAPCILIMEDLSSKYLIQRLLKNPCNILPHPLNCGCTITSVHHHLYKHQAPAYIKNFIHGLSLLKTH